MPRTRIREARQGDVVAFVPEARTNRVHVLVDAVTVGAVGLAFVHGVRCDPEGVVDSQAQHRAWPVAADAEVEVVA